MPVVNEFSCLNKLQGKLLGIYFLGFLSISFAARGASAECTFSIRHDSGWWLSGKLDPSDGDGYARMFNSFDYHTDYADVDTLTPFRIQALFDHDVIIEDQRAIYVEDVISIELAYRGYQRGPAALHYAKIDDLAGEIKIGDYVVVFETLKKATADFKAKVERGSGSTEVEIVVTLPKGEADEVLSSASNIDFDIHIPSSPELFFKQKVILENHPRAARELFKVMGMHRNLAGLGGC